MQLTSDFTPSASQASSAQAVKAQAFQLGSLLSTTSNPGALLFTADKASSASEQAVATDKAAGTGTKTAAQAEQDAKAIAEATKKSPSQGAELLEKYLNEEPDEEYRAELIAHSKPSIAKMGAQGAAKGERGFSQEEYQRTVNAVARATSSLPPSQAQQIADAFASGYRGAGTSSSDPLAQAMGLPSTSTAFVSEPVARDPATATFAHFLSSSYSAQGNTAMANSLKERATTPAALMGPSMPTGSKTKADAERDAQALREKTFADPQGGAEMLERLLSEEPNEEYKTALLKASGDSLARLATLVAQDQPRPGKTQGLVGPLGRAAENLTPEQTRLLADGFAAGNPHAKAGSTQDPLLVNLQREMQGGDGAAFTYALAQSYAARGNKGFAQALTQTAVKETEKQRAAFEDKKKSLDDEWARLAANMDPALTPAQREKLHTDFLEKNKGKYAELEQMAEKLAPLTRDFMKAAMDPKLENDPEIAKHREKIAKSLPMLAETKAGGEMFAQEAAKQEKGEPSLFDGAVEFGEKHFKPATDFLNSMTVALSKGVSLNIMRAAQSGDTEAAKRAFSALEKNAQLFGASQSDLREAIKLFDGLKPGMTKAEQDLALAKINKELNKSGSAIPLFDPSTPQGQAFRGVSLLFSTALVTDGFSKWDEKDNLSDRVKLFGDALKVGVDGSTLALEALAQHSVWVEGAMKGAGGAVLRGAGAFAGLVVAVGDGIKSAEYFQKRDFARGMSNGLLSAGGIMMSMGAASEFIPGWGQTAGTALLITGAVLVGTGTVWNAILGSEDPAKRREALKATGITDENVLKGLSNANAQRVREWQNMGFTPEQMQELARMSPSLLSGGKHEEMVQLQNFSREYGLSNEQILDLFRTLGHGGNTDGAAQSFMSGLTGFQVNTNGRIDWDKELSLRAQGPGTQGATQKVWQNAQRYVNAYGNRVIKPGADY